MICVLARRFRCQGIRATSSRMIGERDQEKFPFMRSEVIDDEEHRRGLYEPREPRCRMVNLRKSRACHAYFVEPPTGINEFLESDWL